MRNKIWKKGISITLAAMMMTGTISVPVMQGRSTVSIVKAEEKTMPESPSVIDGYVYATVNMEYADFFYGELNNIEAGKDTTPALDSDQAASFREKGMYDAVTSATSTKSTKYATSYYEIGVTNDEKETTGKDGSVTNTNLYGIRDVQIAIPEELYSNLYKNENKSHKVYEYLKNATYSDTAFSTEYKVLNADGTFSKMITTDGTVEDTDADPVLTTSTVWGDYQIDVANLGVDDVQATTENLYGIVLTDKDGVNYGLLHSDNTWLQTQEFSWAVDDDFSVHGENTTPYQRTNGLNAGNTITKITYLLKDSPDIEINTNVKLKTLIGEDVTGSAEAATYNASGTQVKFVLNNVPADDYTVTDVVKGARHGKAVDADKFSYNKETGILTLDGRCEAGDDYVATFKSETHGDIKVTFAVNKADQSVTAAKDAYTVTYGVKAFNLGAKAGSALTYTSSNNNVAVVDANGNVTIKGAGSAVITINAEENNYYNAAVKTVKITVNKANASITTSAKSTVSKAYGAKAFSLGAKATSGTTLKYKSSSTKVATVSSKGVVTIKGTGTATITVTASGVNYNTATKKITVKVSPKKQTVKLKAGKKKAAIQWKKDTKATGYQIKIGTKKNLSGAKTYTVKSYKTYKKTVSKLKSKKKYYVKVRAYKTVGKTKLYGAYSAVKSVKVK